MNFIQPCITKHNFSLLKNIFYKIKSLHIKKKKKKKIKKKEKKKIIPYFPKKLYKLKIK